MKFNFGSLLKVNLGPLLEVNVGSLLQAHVMRRAAGTREFWQVSPRIERERERDRGREGERDQIRNHREREIRSELSLHAQASSGRCRGTSLIRNNAPLGPYSRTMPMALWWS